MSIQKHQDSLELMEAIGNHGAVSPHYHPPPLALLHEGILRIKETHTSSFPLHYPGTDELQADSERLLEDVGPQVWPDPSIVDTRMWLANPRIDTLRGHWHRQLVYARPADRNQLRYHLSRLIFIKCRTYANSLKDKRERIANRAVVPGSDVTPNVDSCCHSAGDDSEPEVKVKSEAGSDPEEDDDEFYGVPELFDERAHGWGDEGDQGGGNGESNPQKKDDGHGAEEGGGGEEEAEFFDHDDSMDRFEDVNCGVALDQQHRVPAAVMITPPQALDASLPGTAQRRATVDGINHHLNGSPIGSRLQNGMRRQSLHPSAALPSSSGVDSHITPAPTRKRQRSPEVDEGSFMQPPWKMSQPRRPSEMLAEGLFRGMSLEPTSSPDCGARDATEEVEGASELPNPFMMLPPPAKLPNPRASITSTAQSYFGQAGFATSGMHYPETPVKQQAAVDQQHTQQPGPHALPSALPQQPQPQPTTFHKASATSLPPKTLRLILTSIADGYQKCRVVGVDTATTVEQLFDSVQATADSWLGGQEVIEVEIQAIWRFDIRQIGVEKGGMAAWAMCMREIVRMEGDEIEIRARVVV
ncbi:hypothetical protein LTR09_008014 [Extremus antarcticus]|uniref:Uncharacterized protein n=1 Tax=Extremus antarcticus TaxID=702011 RepID=A0AAJ0DC10_9PEZI|nr:hypothetical protein LTR09_008014 [Extremus antarcticus]